MAKKVTLPRMLRCVGIHANIALAEVNKRLNHLRETRSLDREQFFRLFNIIYHLEHAMEKKDEDESNQEAAAAATSSSHTCPHQEPKKGECIDPARHPVLADRQRRRSLSRLDFVV